ncbi:ATP-binding protein [Aeromonas veronii]|uniref:ATP-binding protein n=1 Tax=Aeromonas veronii TaxID=654 RepID=UPI002B49F64E|nr:transporter substrate-binding domain-containing protein [Aeromonas veronii]
MMIIRAMIILITLGFQTNTKANDFTLLGRDSIDKISISISSEKQQWLHDKGQLTVGFSLPENPPFDMTSNGTNQYYEGLSADYIRLLERLLNVKVILKPYKSRIDAIKDIKSGKVDLLTTSNRFEEFHSLVLSTSYVKDMPAIYISERTEQKKNIKTIAMAYDYLPDSEIYKIYPNVTLVHYPSRQEAVAAAVFGQTDAVIIDLFSANYLVNNTFAKRLILNKILPVNTRGFGFAISPALPQLKEIVDDVIRQIPASEHWAIKKRWSGSGLTIPDNHYSALLSSAEKEWLNAHESIRIVVNEFNAPITYFDQNKQFHGFAADVITAFRLYTGVNISITRAQSYKEVSYYLKNGYADAAIMYSSNNKEHDLIFSKELTTSPFVLVMAKNTDPMSLRRMRVAIPQEHSINHDFDLNNIQIEIIYVKSYLDAMDFVSTGKADATISPLNVADYYIGRYFPEQLNVNQLVKSLPPATISLVAEKKSAHIISIMDKVLSSIPPDELQAIENRWRMNAIPGQETWRDYKYTIYTMTSAAILLIIASLFWAWFTRSHYIKRLEAQKKLREQFLFMQDIVDSIPHPIYVRDTTRRLVLCNKSYQTVFNENKSEILFKYPHEGEHRVAEAKELDLEYQQALLEGTVFRKDRRIHIDGVPVDIYHWIQPYKDQYGVIQGIIGGWIDVSDRVKLMSALTQAKEHADIASRAKTQFLATMSHEIRTPMNAVIGLLELALKQAESQTFDFQSIRVAHDSAKGLLVLLGDILDVIKIEAGELTLTPTSINFRQTLESVARIFEGLAIQKELELSLEIDPLIPEVVCLDSLRVKQILSNLIGNAIKFTEHGFIKVRAQQAIDKDGNRQLLIHVEDSGIGIPAEEQQHLFKPFAQAHHGVQSRGGTGLGLAICRSLCDLMNGELTLESAPSKGTRVSMVLPLRAAAHQVMHVNEPLLEQAHQPTTSCYNILIVDDHPANRILLSQQLKYLGHTVDEASNGQEALKLYMQHRHQVVITDCNMPLMDGYELSYRLRGWEEAKCLTPSIILGYTANAQLEARDACLAAGMNDCLFKPISLDDIRKKLEQFDNKGNSSSTATYFQPHRLTELLGNNPIIARQLLNELLATTEKDIAQLHESIKQQNLVSIKAIVHKVKGAARIISSQQAIDCCERVEKSQDFDEAKAESTYLMAILTSLSNEVEAYLEKNTLPPIL